MQQNFPLKRVSSDAELVENIVLTNMLPDVVHLTCKPDSKPGTAASFSALLETVWETKISVFFKKIT